MKRATGLLWITLLTWLPPAMAVCVNGHPSVKEEYRHAPIVVVARVASERATSESKRYLEGTIYSVVVKEVLRGTPGKTISLFSENSSGRFPMEVGKSYLLFVHKELGLQQVDYCGNSGVVSDRSAVLAAVRRFRQ